MVRPFSGERRQRSSLMPRGSALRGSAPSRSALSRSATRGSTGRRRSKRTAQRRASRSPRSCTCAITGSSSPTGEVPEDRVDFECHRFDLAVQQAVQSLQLPDGEAPRSDRRGRHRHLPRSARAAPGPRTPRVRPRLRPQGARRRRECAAAHGRPIRERVRGDRPRIDPRTGLGHPGCRPAGAERAPSPGPVGAHRQGRRLRAGRRRVPPVRPRFDRDRPRARHPDGRGGQILARCDPGEVDRHPVPRRGSDKGSSSSTPGRW